MSLTPDPPTSNTTLFTSLSPFIIPILCVAITCTAVAINYIHHRQQPSLPPKDMQKAHVDYFTPEVPGDTVEMYVELEVDEEADRLRRAAACELDGRSLREVREMEV
jgi:hypothetical protein